MARNSLLLARASHAFSRLVIVVCLFVCRTAFAAGDPLRLVVVAEGGSRPVVAVKDGRVLVERDGRQTPAALDSRWEIQGDLTALGEVADCSPEYGISRRSAPDGERRPETAWRALVTVSHLEGADPMGKEVDSQLLKTWPDALRAETALVVLWLLEGRPEKIQVVAVPARREGYFSRSFRFLLDERQRAGRPVVLVWQEGRFLPVVPRFAEPDVQAAYLAVLRDDLAALAPMPDAARVARANLLHHAAEAGALGAARRLLDAEADVDQRNSRKETPMHYAAAHGRLEVVKLLLERKARSDLSDHLGFTPLHGAARGGHTPVVEALLATKRVKADLTTEQGQSALGLALTRGYADIARVLAERDKRTVDFRGEQAERVLVDQASRGHTGIVRLMIEKKTPVTQLSRGRGALLAAAVHDDLELIDALLAAGAPPDQASDTGATPLMMAARSGHADVARRLLAAGASVQSRDSLGRTALQLAAFGDKPEVVDLLLNAGASVGVSAPGLPSPLALALLAGSQRVLPVLEAAGAAHLWKAADGTFENEKQVRERLLFLALAADRELVVREALDAGWSAETRIGGWPLLALARLYGASRCGELLIGRGAAVDAETPLRVVGPRQLDELPRPVRLVPPPDPREPGEEFPEATVKLDFLLGAEGEVLFPRVVESPDLRLSFAVLEASQAWRFTPPRSEGRPVAGRLLLPLAYPSSENRPYESNDVDEMVRVLRRSAPVYPLEMRKSGEIGSVSLKFEVSPEGVVENIRVASSSNRHFEAPAIEALCQWRFTPGRRDGLPVRVTLMQEFEFRLAR